MDQKIDFTYFFIFPPFSFDYFHRLRFDAFSDKVSFGQKKTLVLSINRDS